LRVFDADSGGTSLYTEEHNMLSLDAQGGFSVQLGLGANPSGPFDVSLFSSPDRWLEVVADSQTLSPRQILGSVPWAFVAQQANEIVPDLSGPRFADCGDGTIEDKQSGLLWEKKTGTPGSPVSCADVGCPDVHDVNNVYRQGSPNGFTDLLMDPLNRSGLFRSVTPAEALSDALSLCFAGRCDWRAPSIRNLRSIMVGADAPSTQAQSCSSAPCIDPALAAIDGPMASAFYWSTSENAENLGNYWFVGFNGGFVSFADGAINPIPGTYNEFRVRLVTTGSCP